MNDETRSNINQTEIHQPDDIRKEESRTKIIQTMKTRTKSKPAVSIADGLRKYTEPNQALEPTTMPVTFRAYARTAPGMVAAQF